jgi:hypothetical protein
MSTYCGVAMTWSNVRQLQSMTMEDDSYPTKFRYDAQGLRTWKNKQTSNYVWTSVDYVYADGRLQREIRDIAHDNPMILQSHYHTKYIIDYNYGINGISGMTVVK